MELQNGRPADAAGRLEKEIRTYDFLDELGVDYQRVDHEAAFTMEACKEVDEALSVEMCKNLFLCNRQKTDFYLLLLLGDKVFKTKELSKQIGSARLSFGCHPCVNTSSIRVKTKDMFDTVIKAMHHEMTVVRLTGEESK